MSVCEVGDISRCEALALLEACRAAIRYDESICGRAARGEVDLLENGCGVATGDDMDALYFDWMEKARDAVAKVEGKR